MSLTHYGTSGLINHLGGYGMLVVLITVDLFGKGRVDIDLEGAVFSYPNL